MSFIQCPDCGQILKHPEKHDNQHLQEHREKTHGPSESVKQNAKTKSPRRKKG